jgi:hypothetical protein
MNQLGVDTSVSVAPAIKRKPRLGFVGIGWIGQHRMKKVVESGMAEICTLVDPQSDGGQLFSGLQAAVRV